MTQRMAIQVYWQVASAPSSDSSLVFDTLSPARRSNPLRCGTSYPRQAPCPLRSALPKLTPSMLLLQVNKEHLGIGGNVQTAGHKKKRFFGQRYMSVNREGSALDQEAAGSGRSFEMTTRQVLLPHARPIPYIPERVPYCPTHRFLLRYTRVSSSELARRGSRA
eukprot:1379408-Rhodomonas_salina.1